MEQGMSIRIGFHGLVKGLVHKWVIVALTEYVGHDTSVTKVKDGAQVEFVDSNAFVPLKFRRNCIHRDVRL